MSYIKIFLILLLLLQAPLIFASSIKSKSKPVSDLTFQSTPKSTGESQSNSVTQNSLTTIKTKQIDAVQELVVPQNSPYSKLYLEAIKSKKIPSKALNTAFKFLLNNESSLKPESLCLSKDNLKNRTEIRNKNCLIIADYTKSKLEPRLHIFKFNESKIYSLLSAHGKGSNIKENDLIAKKFSNQPNSLQTSLGFYLTAESYSSTKNTFGPGPNNGVKLDGLECQNNNARKRYIVMHTAKYVVDEIKTPESIGYSEGCVTVSPTYKELILSCKEGALLYNFAD